MGESVVDRISKRISDTTGLETKHPFAEDIQVENSYLVQTNQLISNIQYNDSYAFLYPLNVF